MGEEKPRIVITGATGNLGVRLMPLLHGFDIIAVGRNAPRTDIPVHFVRMDLGKEESCRELFLLLREYRPIAVVHLAFVIDQVRSGVLDLDEMWHINVAGTARVMEAITEANRDDFIVGKFIYCSSASVYGPRLPEPAKEETPLGAHTLPYTIHKMEADQVVQQRAPALRGCSAFLLRPHIFAGATVENYLIGTLRGTPSGNSARAARMREQGKRLPCMLPWGKRYQQNRIQFVHVDDVARLIVYILQRTEPEAQRLTIMNVAGRGAAITLAQCIETAQAKLVQVPGTWVFRNILKLLWKLGISAVPPEAAPYMTGEYLLNTDRLQKFLGQDYEAVIRNTIPGALADCLAASSSSSMTAEHAGAQ